MSKHIHLWEYNKVNVVCVLFFVPSEAYEKMEFIYLKAIEKKSPLLDPL